MIKYSILDLCPIFENSTAKESLARALSTARHAEKLGYNRFWVAEHHNMQSIASAATSVVIGHLASGTSSIRVGAGGIMLPNHSPLVIAEQFGTLETLYPKRIDLGLGRAPGTDQLTSRAMRRDLNASNEFPQDVLELLSYLDEPQPKQQIIAVPGADTQVPVWILGSSQFGARLAAEYGLPYSFASHFAPAELYNAVEVYRHYFKPSKYLDKPYFMVAMNVIAADTDEEAHFLASSRQRMAVELLQGKVYKIQRPQKGYVDSLSQQQRFGMNSMLSCSAIGSLTSIQQKISEVLNKTQADELILSDIVFEHDAQLRSIEIAAQAMANINQT